MIMLFFQNNVCQGRQLLAFVLSSMYRYICISRCVFTHDPYLFFSNLKVNFTRTYITRSKERKERQDISMRKKKE